MDFDPTQNGTSKSPKWRLAAEQSGAVARSFQGFDPLPEVEDVLVPDWRWGHLVQPLLEQSLHDIAHRRSVPPGLDPQGLVGVGVNPDE